MKFKLFCLFLLSSLAVQGSSAQTSASTKSTAPAPVVTPKPNGTRAQTLEWIQRQMASSGASYNIAFISNDPKQKQTWHRNTRYGNVALNKCELDIDKTIVDYGRHRSAHYTIPLWDLASANYQLDSGNAQFKYTPPVPALFFRNHTKSMHWARERSQVATNVIEIEFGQNPSYGRAKITQLGLAFQHLAGTCMNPKPSTSK